MAQIIGKGDLTAHHRTLPLNEILGRLFTSAALRVDRRVHVVRSPSEPPVIHSGRRKVGRGLVATATTPVTGIWPTRRCRR